MAEEREREEEIKRMAGGRRRKKTHESISGYMKNRQKCGEGEERAVFLYKLMNKSDSPALQYNNIFKNPSPISPRQSPDPPKGGGQIRTSHSIHKY